MNTYRYMIDEGKVIPMHGYAREVPSHHIALIEHHAAHMADGGDVTLAVVRTGKNLKMVPLTEAMHNVLARRAEVVCFYYCENDEAFGPIWHYHILEN